MRGDVVRHPFTDAGFETLSVEGTRTQSLAGVSSAAALEPLPPSGEHVKQQHAALNAVAHARAVRALTRPSSYRHPAVLSPREDSRRFPPGRRRHADAHEWSVETDGHGIGMAEVRAAVPDGWRLLRVRVNRG